MKKFRKLLSLVLAMVMVLAMAVPSFAQTIAGTSSDNASITISNASKGETYSIYKLFDATVTGTAGGSIAYTGNIPDALSTYFEKDSAGNITATAAAEENGEMSEELRSALANWAKGETATQSAVSDGSQLVFSGLDYGYYVVTTSQGEQTITVTSTNPDAAIVDKNETLPTEPEEGEVKTSSAGDNGVYIGETVTYTINFNTTNYIGSGEDAEKVLSYTIEDTLPDFLKNVTVTKITIDGEEYKVNDAVPQFSNKKITIPWVDKDEKSLYDNGAAIVITYTAVVTDEAVIAGEGNKNEVTITWETEDGEGEGSITGEETISTYAIAIKKVDQNGQNLPEAKFSVKGITVNGSNGVYVVTGSGDSLNTGALECDSNGELVIKGVQAGTYEVTEEVAPDGYNKLTASMNVVAEKTSETTTSITQYLDEDGNVTSEETNVEVTYQNNNLKADALIVVNKTGAMLPSTGGIGTTIFYAAGIVLMAGAVFFVVRRKRA